MSAFVDMLIDMLPVHSELQKKDNPFRKVLNNTVGAYMDQEEDLFSQLFVDSATGGWLDAHGRDYNVPRKLGESDEDYRERIIFEKLEYLTTHNLQEIYNIELYNFRSLFNPENNDLTSDNPYLTNEYIGVADEETQKILNKKFILKGGIIWLDGKITDYIMNTSDKDELINFANIYDLESMKGYFASYSDIESVKLNLPKAVNADGMFYECSGLTTAILSLPEVVTAVGMFTACSDLTSVNLDLANCGNADYLLGECSSLESVVLNIPSVSNHYSDIFYGCSSIETLDVNIHSSAMYNFEDYVLGLGLANLTSFILNGEEVDLS